MIAIGNNSSRR